jgi:predicted MFS family arabinose efflux permease
MAAGAAIGGLVRDWTGDFNYTMALSLVLGMVGVVSILVLPTTSRQLIPHWEDALPQEARSPTPG